MGGRGHNYVLHGSMRSWGVFRHCWTISWGVHLYFCVSGLDRRCVCQEGATHNSTSQQIWGGDLHPVREEPHTAVSYGNYDGGSKTLIRSSICQKTTRSKKKMRGSLYRPANTDGLRYKCRLLYQLLQFPDLHLTLFRLAWRVYGKHGRPPLPAARGEWKNASQLIDEMRRKGLKPDRYSYTSAIHACSKARNPMEALRLLRAMEANNVGATGMIASNRP